MLEEPVENVVDIGKDIRKMYKQFKKLEHKSKWKNVKVKESTYEEIKKLTKSLSIPMHETIDLAITTLEILLHERIKMPKDIAERLGLTECEDVHDAWYYYLLPSCVLHKYILEYFKNRLRVQVLINNLRKMAKEEREQIQS